MSGLSVSSAPSSDNLESDLGGREQCPEGREQDTDIGGTATTSSALGNLQDECLLPSDVKPEDTQLDNSMTTSRGLSSCSSLSSSSTSLSSFCVLESEMEQPSFKINRPLVFESIQDRQIATEAEAEAEAEVEAQSSPSLAVDVTVNEDHAVETASDAANLSGTPVIESEMQVSFLSQMQTEPELEIETLVVASCCAELLPEQTVPCEDSVSTLAAFTNQIDDAEEFSTNDNDDGSNNHFNLPNLPPVSSSGFGLSTKQVGVIVLAVGVLVGVGFRGNGYSSSAPAVQGDDQDGVYHSDMQRSDVLYETLGDCLTPFPEMQHLQNKYQKLKSLYRVVRDRNAAFRRVNVMLHRSLREARMQLREGRAHYAEREQRKANRTTSTQTDTQPEASKYQLFNVVQSNYLAVREEWALQLPTKSDVAAPFIEPDYKQKMDKDGKQASEELLTQIGTEQISAEEVGLDNKVPVFVDVSFNAQVDADGTKVVDALEATAQVKTTSSSDSTRCVHATANVDDVCAPESKARGSTPRSHNDWYWHSVRHRQEARYRKRIEDAKPYNWYIRNMRRGAVYRDV